MEGRRVTRKNQKTNPLFILFLCLVAAVIVLLIVSVVFGIRLGAANKKLKASEEQVKELTETVAKLNEDLEQAKSSSPAAEPQNTQPAIPGTETGTPADASAPGEASWIDLTGHSEVKVKPTNLLDGYATAYTTAGVNMRGGPGTSYDRITTVDYGEKVQIAARENGWSFVKYGSKFGWISSDYLSDKEPARTSSSSTSGSSGSSGQRTEATSGSIRR